MDSVEQQANQELLDTWGAGNIPPGLSLEFEEIMLPELGIRKCRSFRADLVHKLNIICRVRGTWAKTAKALGTRDCVVRAWRAWKACPGSMITLQRIDSEYEMAIEKLRLEARKSQSKQG
jgi:hypothetical protein